MLKAAIEYKENNTDSTVYENFEVVTYNHTKEHKNIVITDTLNAIEDVVLFRLANYFLKFSLQYKKMSDLSALQNDWYEYVEYGTTNPLTIMLQRNGFSRETATYIKKHEIDYIVKIDNEYKVKSTLVQCASKAVCHEATEIRYNIPELFV